MSSLAEGQSPEDHVDAPPTTDDSDGNTGENVATKNGPSAGETAPPSGTVV